MTIGGGLVRYITASEIIDMLKSQKIDEAVGQIKMSLNGTDVVMRQNDIIGNALQEWLGQFLKVLRDRRFQIFICQNRMSEIYVR